MILITGGFGQLGTDLALECQKRSIEYVQVGYNEFDITDEQQVNHYFSEHAVDTIIHCAAYTAVDLAEDEHDLCYRINVDGTHNLVKVAKENGIKFLYVSTDYVFDGEKSSPYEVLDQPNPSGVYGKSKYEGEVWVQSLLSDYFIVRISWVFGLNGKNFVKTMLRLAQDRKEVAVVSDQFGSPTYTKDAAERMIDIALSNYYGVYHLTNEGYTTWAEFASFIFKCSGLVTQVKPILSKDYPTKAKRPMNSKLSKQSLDDHGFKRLATWQDATERFIVELKKSGELK